jgi:hypothetical protein
MLDGFRSNDHRADLQPGIQTACGSDANQSPTFRPDHQGLRSSQSALHLPVRATHKTIGGVSDDPASDIIFFFRNSGDFSLLKGSKQQLNFAAQRDNNKTRGELNFRHNGEDLPPPLKAGKSY